ncbi:hypothetical protein CBR_g23968, partial [Chara braunii]
QGAQEVPCAITRYLHALTLAQSSGGVPVPNVLLGPSATLQIAKMLSLEQPSTNIAPLSDLATNPHMCAGCVSCDLCRLIVKTVAWQQQHV